MQNPEKKMNKERKIKIFVSKSNLKNSDADVFLPPGEEASPEGGGVWWGAEAARGAGGGEEEGLGGDAGAAPGHR